MWKLWRGLYNWKWIKKTQDCRWRSHKHQWHWKPWVWLCAKEILKQWTMHMRVLHQDGKEWWFSRHVSPPPRMLGQVRPHLSRLTRWFDTCVWWRIFHRLESLRPNPALLTGAAGLWRHRPVLCGLGANQKDHQGLIVSYDGFESITVFYILYLGCNASCLSMPLEKVINKS